METFKILKFSTPISIRNLLSFLPKTEKLRLEVPRVKLNTTKQNFFFVSTQIWNDMSTEIFEKCNPDKNGLIIPGSSKDSDLSASTGIIKNKLKCHLLSLQKLGNASIWWKITTSVIHMNEWMLSCTSLINYGNIITVTKIRLVFTLQIDHPSGFHLWPLSTWVVASMLIFTAIHPRNLIPDFSNL